MRTAPLFLVLGVACAARTPPNPAAADADTCTIIGINDTYRVGPKRDGSGGFGRVRSLIRSLGGRPHLTLHAGDVLFPSLLSREFNGQQMIAALNLLDGDPNADDPTLLVTLGNHELEKAKPGPLQAALDASGFDWLSGNVRFAEVDGTPTITSARLSPWRLVPCGSLQVGVLGVTLDDEKPAWVASFDDAVATVAASTAALREAGADVVVALTHLEAADDRRILAELGDRGPDLVLGGHDHAAMREEVGGRLLLKADADTASANLVTVRKTSGRPQITAEILPLRDDGPRPMPVDPAFAALDVDWNLKFDTLFCTKKAAPGAAVDPNCLRVPLGSTTVDLIGEELTIRRFETNLGDWVADRMLAEGAAKGAQIAFTNAGGLRLNQDIPAGSAITLRDVEELLPYPNEQRLIRITGAQLQRVIDRAVQGWTGSGHWLQIAGFAYRHDPIAGAATGLTLLTPAGPRAIRPEETLLAVTNDYLLGGGDGYAVLTEVERLDTLTPLKTLLVDALRSGGPIAPTVEGRICHGDRAPCLAR
jgi:2',3'-cyclic-nucleotide 2'-phosphodiesterase (5'-nucleotidase family)